MNCLITFIKTDDFEEAMTFLDKINSLPGGTPVRSRKKYLVINTAKKIDSRLMQNKTGNINVHIVSKGEEGKFIVKQEVNGPIDLWRFGWVLKNNLIL